MKKVLILGAIDSFCDLIEDFRNKGIETIACDYYEGAPGKAIADYAYDVSTLDVDRLVEIGREHNIDGVMCAFSDRNLQPCYEVAERLGLPQMYTPQLIEKLSDKIKMKETLAKGGFPILNYRIVKADFADSELEDFCWPVIIKPVDSSGSKGVYICDTPDQIREKMSMTLEKSVNYKDTFLVEEYYPYDEISITAWAQDGRSYVTCVYDNGKNFSRDSEMNVSLSSVVFPSKYTDEHIDEYRELVQGLVTAFEVVNGPVTVQCFVGPKGLKVNEFIFRLAGDGAYMCSAVLGAPAVADMTEDFVVGNSIDTAPLREFTPAGKAKHYQIGIYANVTGRVFFDFTSESLMRDVPGCVRADVYGRSGDEYKFVTTGGIVIARIYVKADDSFGGYTDYLKLLQKIAAVRNEKGDVISDLHIPH